MSGRKIRFGMVLTGLVIAAILFAAAFGAPGLISGKGTWTSLLSLRGCSDIRTLADLEVHGVSRSQNAVVLYDSAFNEVETACTREEVQAVTTFVSPAAREEDEHLLPLVRRVVAKSGKAISIAHEAANKSKCRFPVDWNKGFDAQFPHHERLRHIACLASASAILNARDGRMDKAVDDLELAYKVAESLKNEPAFDSFITRVAIIDMASRSLKRITCYGGIVPAKFEQLARTLSGIDTAQGLKQAIECEQAMGLWLFDQVKKDPTKVSLKSKVFSDSTVAEGVASRLVDRVKQPVLELDRKAYLNYMDGQMRITRLPYREAKQLFEEKCDIPSYAMLTGVLAKDYSGLCAARDCALAQIIGSRVVLALEVYHSRFGSYPASLRELTEGVRWNPSEDPFSGREMVYKRQGAGFILYSIGPDLDDDAGIQPASTADVFSQGDIVWKSGRWKSEVSAELAEDSTWDQPVLSAR